MLNEMIKNAGCTLHERVKIAAAVVAMHHYDRTQNIIGSAQDIKKTAALQGIDIPDEMAIQAAAESYLENDMKKTAGFKEKLMSLISKPSVRIPGAALAGGGAAAGGAALAGEDDPKALALAGLLGGGAGAFMGSTGTELAQARRALMSKGQAYKDIFSGKATVPGFTS